MDLRENESIKNLAYVLNKHVQKNDSLFETFLRYLSVEPTLSELAERHSDPEDLGSLVSNFILMTRGSKSQVKYNTLIYFVQNHKMNKAVSGLTNTSTFTNEYESTT